ncbi:SigE family RNA polymerase sigma factor [Nocardioides soli]
MSSRDPGFEEFYAAHASRMVKVAYSIVRDKHAAEDVVQAAFVKAFAAWWRVRRADDPVAYTRRIVVNTALAHLRKPARRFEHSRAEVPDRPAAQPDVMGTGPGEVWDLLGQLPPRRRAIVVLRYFEGLSEREIADVLGCRPGTVKSQASAALRTLRDRLGTHDAERDSGRGHRS